jgi:hypothetical protein
VPTAHARDLAIQYESWNPDNPQPFTELAGEAFLGTDENLALFRTAEGCVMHVHPGWSVLRLPDDPAQPMLMTPTALRRIFRS